MIKDLFVSFTENIKTKTSNPFFGTLVIVWFTKNWNLIYSVFNFDPKATLEVKRKFINSHFTELPLIKTLAWCILETFIILVISYLLINLTRLIVNFFEKKVTPYVYKWTDNSSIVLKSTYDELDNERKRLENRVDEDRVTKQKLLGEIEKLEQKLGESRLNISNTDSVDLIEDRKENSNDIKLNLIFEKLKSDSKQQQFEKIAEAILNDTVLPKDDKFVKEFTSLGLITFKRSYSVTSVYYSLTSLGERLHERYLLEKLSPKK